MTMVRVGFIIMSLIGMGDQHCARAEETVEHLIRDHVGAGPPKVVIDTDPGIDDAMALLLAFAAHKRGEIEILALTTTLGNHNDQDLLAKNACFLLQTAGLETTIPVFKGRSDPIAGPYHGYSGIQVHGENGLGGVPLPFEPTLAPIQPETAADYLVSITARFPGEITLITLGPLTNVAFAIQSSPTFPSTVKRLIMMGGDVKCCGNKSPSAEANVHNDPEAAKIVFNSLPDIVMCGLNNTKHAELSDKFRVRIRDAAGEVGSFVYAITQHYVDLLASWKETRVASHDSMAVMALLHPEMFRGAKVCVDVETKGEITRGATIADWFGHWKRPRNTLVMQSVNEAAFHDAYVDYVKDFAGVSFASFASVSTTEDATAE